MKQIRVLLIEDHFSRAWRFTPSSPAIRRFRSSERQATARLGISMYRQLRPDVVVSTFAFRVSAASRSSSELRREFPNVRIVVLSNYQGSEDIYRAVRSGAMAYLTKDASGEELLNAIQNVDRGLRYLPHRALDLLAERMPAVDLTPREPRCSPHHPGPQQPRDRRRSQIAEKTVRIHVSSVLDKMGARDRTQATIYALQRGLVHLRLILQSATITPISQCLQPAY